MGGRYDHPREQTGLGTSRAGDQQGMPDELPEGDRVAPDRDDVSSAVVTGATTSGHMSESGAGMANRSGSGGSGGSGEGATEEEGSAGASLEELLGADERPGDRTG